MKVSADHTGRRVRSGATVRVAIAVVAAATLAAACGDDAGSTTTSAAVSTTAAASTTTVVTTTTASTTTTETAAPSESVITISGFAFGDPITVTVGTEITVVNRDAAAHTWSSLEGKFDSGSLGSGATFAFTFTEAGTYGFFCGIHPSMTGSITVTG